jgi:hypothetical protein
MVYRRVVVAGLIATLSLVAQTPSRPRGRGPGGWGPRGPANRQVVTGAPFSASEVRTSQQVLANGTVIQRQEQRQIYRDGQGRVRTETTRQGPNGEARMLVTISDPVAGVVHELDMTHKTVFNRQARFTAQTPRNTTGNPSPRIRGGTQTETKENLAAQTINGVFASGTRVTRTIPSETIGNSQPIQRVQETWMAEDLKVPVMTTFSDPRTGTVVTQFTNINRSEPDASLFQVPSGFTIRTGPRGSRGAAR